MIISTHYPDAYYDRCGEAKRLRSVPGDIETAPSVRCSREWRSYVSNDGGEIGR
jgi:hypothetical protein